MTTRFLPLLTALLCMAGCAAPRAKAKTDDKKPPPGPELVGRIASIPADKRFVLIQSYGSWKGESGQILTTRGPADRVANLRLTGEKLADFSAADLQSGTVEIGDAVYSHPPENPVTLTPTAVPPPAGLAEEVPSIPKNN